MKLMFKLINIFMTDANKLISAVFILTTWRYDVLNFIRDTPHYLY